MSSAQVTARSWARGTWVNSIATHALSVGLLLLTLGGCTARQPTAIPGAVQVERTEPADRPTAEPEHRPDSEFRLDVLPRSQYRLIDSHRFDDPQLGYALRYTGPRRPRVDVFVYPIAPAGSEVADSVRARLVAQEVDSGIRDIEEHAERNSWTLDQSSKISEVRVETLCGPVAAHHYRVGFAEADGKRRDSHLIVLSVEGTFVKLRSTFPEERAPEWEGHIAALLEELMSGLPVCEPE